MTPEVPAHQPQITTQQLVHVLFGNPINPQDKGIIGQLQDQMRQIINLGRLVLIAFVGAIFTAAADLIVHYRP